MEPAPWYGELRCRVEGMAVFARVAAPRGRGAVTPAVLLHGLGVASPYTLPLLRAVARARAAFAPDLPGFGRSERPPSVLGVEDLARIAAGFVRMVVPRPPVVAANSLGCQVAVELAVREPGLVRGLVLAGPTTDPAARSVVRQALRAARTARHEPPGEPLVVAADYLRTGARRLLATERSGVAHPIERCLAQVEVPVVVARGEHDAIVPERWARRAAELVPRGRFVSVPDAAHALTYSSPEVLAALVEELASDG